MMHLFFQTTRRYMLLIEEMHISILGWLSAFLGVLWIRFFLEAFSSRNVSGFIPSDLSTNVHYFLFYLAMTLAMALTLHLFSRTSVDRTMKVALFALPVVWLAPIIDLLWTGGARMAYLFVSPGTLVSDFFSFFGPLHSSGITVGMRIEIAIILVFSALYIHLKTGSFVRTFLGALGIYTVIFASTAFPSLLLVLSGATGSVAVAWVYVIDRSLLPLTAFHPTETYEAFRTFELLFNMAMIQALYLVVVVLGMFFFRSTSPQVLRAVKENIRPARLCHFLALALAGGAFAVMPSESQWSWTALDGVTWIVGACTIIFVWVFSVTTNDLVDESIDKVSNPSRPLVTGAVTHTEMRDVAVVTGLMALGGGIVLGSYAFYFIGVFLGAYFIYSMPPLRLKRIPLVAPLLISTAFLSCTLFGFFLVSDIRELSAFPGAYAILIIIAHALGVHMKDLKDIEGDRAGGIMTLPVLFGEKLGRTIIGGMLFLGFMLVPVFFTMPIFLVPCLIAGSILWVGIVRGAGESLVFRVYFITMLVLAVMFFFFR